MIRLLLRRFSALLTLVVIYGVPVSAALPDVSTDTAIIHELLDSAKGHLYTNNAESYAFADKAIKLSEETGYPIGMLDGHTVKGGRWWSEMQWDSALYHYQRAAEIAAEYHLEKFFINAIANVGFVYTYMNEPDSALLYLQKSADYARKGNYKVALIEGLMKLGNQYERVNEYPSAARVYGEALDLAQTLSNDELQGIAHSALGKLYTKIGDHASALKELKSGAGFLKKTRNTTSLFSTYSNICEIYSNKIVNRDSALLYSALAEQTVPESRKTLFEYINAVNLGTLYFNLDHQDSAFAKFQEAFTNPLNSKLSAENATTLLNIGSYYLTEEKIDSAVTFLNQALATSEKLDLFEVKILALNNLCQIDLRAENYKNAFERQLAINQVVKKLQNTESRNILARDQIERERMAAQYKFNLLQLENEAQRQHIEVQTSRIYLIGLFLGVTIVLMVVLFLQYRSKTLAFLKLVEKNKTITIFYAKQIQELRKSNQEETSLYDPSDHGSHLQHTIEQLEDLMAKKKIFLDPNISAIQLSKALRINRRNLSTLLSSKYQMNFNEFINHYRILEAQRLIMDRNSQNITMSVLSEECGFKTERTFYNAFRHSTGISPMMFKEKLHKYPQ
jgi:AraC-like DNA-binding protein